MTSLLGGSAPPNSPDLDSIQIDIGFMSEHQIVVSDLDRQS